MGGIAGRTEATGLGVYFGIRDLCQHQEIMDKLGLSVGTENKRVVIQGFGNVGYHAAKFFAERGKAKIIGVAERDGYIFNEDGLDVNNLKQYFDDNKSIIGYPAAEFVKGEDRSLEALELECDILVPAAMERVINKDNARKIKAKIIAEAANGPLTPTADTILNSRGVIIVPDLYLNAGGVVVSYFEWLKNLSNVRFGRLNRRFDESRGRMIVQVLQQTGVQLTDEEERKIVRGASERDLTESGLEDTMSDSLRQIIKQKEQIEKETKTTISLRTAAFVLAINKVANVRYKRGLVLPSSATA
eukprot:gene637-3946_t